MSRDTAKEFWAAMIASAEEQAPPQAQPIGEARPLIGTVNGNVFVIGNIAPEALAALMGLVAGTGAKDAR